MKQKTLFEIPIYAMSEKEFNKRWDKKKSKTYEEFIKHGHTEESARKGISSLYFPKCVWKYNQIIGFIQISISRCDIWFDIYLSLDKVYYADSKQKHFIQDIHTNGTHFYTSGKSDDDIKESIGEWLKAIEKDHLRDSFYVDYSTYNNIIDYVNIKQMMETL